MSEDFLYKIGDRVEKYDGDVRFFGEVRCCYHTKAGKARYVIEPDNLPLQLIYSQRQIRREAATRSRGPRPGPMSRRARALLGY